MDPEEIQAEADANGLPVEHFDGHSVVHTPDGPMPIAHTPGARVPRRHAPRRTVDLGPDPVVVHASPEVSATIRQLDDARAQVAAYQAQHGDAWAIDARERTQREIADESARELAAMEQAQGYRVSDPDPYGIQRRTYLDGRRTEEIGPDTAFRAREADRAAAAREAELARLRQTPTSAGVLVGPDGSRVVTDDSGMVLERTYPLPPERSTYDQFSHPLSESRAMVQDAQAIRGVMPPELGGPAPPTALIYGPTLEQLGANPDGTRPAAPAPAPRPGPRGPAAPQMTLPQAYDAVAGLPQARQAFDQTIAGLAGPHAGPRRGPDLIDRQQLLEQQRAGLAGKAAGQQAAIEQQAEQQRQQREAERQQAMAGARQRYQHAIDRVSSAQLDPSHWFRDGGNAVGSVIAVALGALGQALTGSSSNQALDMINQAIARDMDAQRSEIDAARAGADLQGNMIGLMREEFDDRTAADSAAHAAMLQQAALHVQETEAQLADQEARNNADALRQQLEAQAAQAQQEAEAQQAEVDLHRAQALREMARAQQEALRAQRMAAGGGGRPRPVTSSDVQAFRDIMAVNPEISREDAAALAGLPFVPTSTVTVTDEADIAPLDAELAHLESILPADGDIPGVGPLDSRAPDVFTSDAGLDVRSSLDQINELLGRLHSGGAISDQENQRFSRILGSASSQTDQALRRGIQTIRREIAARIRGGARSDSGAERSHASFGFSPGE